MKKICIIGSSGKLGQYMIQHALDLDYQISAVCRKQSVEKLDAFKDRIVIFPGATNDREVIQETVTHCHGVLTVLVPWGMQQYASGTARRYLIMLQQTHVLFFLVGGT